MKRFILSICTVLLALSTNAQTFTADQLEKYAKEKYGDNWLKAAENLKNEVALDNKNRLNYQEVIECPGQTKDQLYNKALEWFNKAFKSQDTHGIIKEQDEEKNHIVAQAYIEDVATQSSGMNHYQVDIAPYIRVDFKEGRVRISAYTDNYEVTVTKGGGLTSMLAGVAATAATAAVTSSDKDKSDSKDSKDSSDSENKTDFKKLLGLNKSSTGADEKWDISSCYPYIAKDKHKKASSKAFVMTSAFQNSIIDILKAALLADSTTAFDDEW